MFNLIVFEEILCYYVTINVFDLKRAKKGEGGGGVKNLNFFNFLSNLLMQFFVKMIIFSGY